MISQELEQLLTFSAALNALNFSAVGGKKHVGGTPVKIVGGAAKFADISKHPLYDKHTGKVKEKQAESQNQHPKIGAAGKPKEPSHSTRGNSAGESDARRVRNKSFGKSRTQEGGAKSNPTSEPDPIKKSAINPDDTPAESPDNLNPTPEKAAIAEASDLGSSRPVTQEEVAETSEAAAQAVNRGDKPLEDVMQSNPELAGNAIVEQHRREREIENQVAREQAQVEQPSQINSEPSAPDDNNAILHRRI